MNVLYRCNEQMTGDVSIVPSLGGEGNYLLSSNKRKERNDLLKPTQYETLVLRKILHLFYSLTFYWTLLLSFHTLKV